MNTSAWLGEAEVATLSDDNGLDRRHDCQLEVRDRRRRLYFCLLKIALRQKPITETEIAAIGNENRKLTASYFKCENVLLQKQQLLPICDHSTRLNSIRFER